MNTHPAPAFREGDLVRDTATGRIGVVQVEAGVYALNKVRLRPPTGGRGWLTHVAALVPAEAPPQEKAPIRP